MWLKACIYGKSGTGKTSLGVSAPKPLILLSESQGLVHIKQAAKRLGVPVPPTYLVESVNDYRMWLQALRGDKTKPLTVKERYEEGGQTRERVVETLEEWPETVVVDSLTDMGRLIIDGIRWQSPPQKGKDGLPVDSQRFWQVLDDRFRNLLIGFRDLPLHTVLLALAEDKEDGEGESRTRSLNPSLPMRKLAQVVCAAVNVVGYTYRRETRKANEPVQLQYGVMTTGPEYMLTKPYRPLRDVELPNFSMWIAAVRGQLATPPPAPVASAESMLSSDEDKSETAEPQEKAEQEPGESKPEPATEPEPKPQRKRAARGVKSDA